jgi:long-chain fatty acid transport protein
MKQFIARRLMTALCASGMLGLSPQAFASAFQLWEQDAASVGNYHAGYAAEADNASIAWYNPAGIMLFKNQQVTLGAVGVMPGFKYKGSVTVGNQIPALPGIENPRTFNDVTAQGGSFGVVPNLHYVTPINDWMGFGFSIDAPFGLETQYGSSTPMRYAATTTSITVIDISPSLAVKIREISFGAGFDIQRAFAEFDKYAASVLTLPDTATDTFSQNKANDTAYGYHLGAMYEFNEKARVGLSYHSQVRHRFTGFSSFQGPIARTILNGDGDELRSRAYTDVTLPAYTALSAYDRVAPQWAVMGSIIYTQWSVFKTLVLNGVSGAIPDPTDPSSFFPVGSNNIQVTIPENYHNTWNVVVGADYYATDNIKLRGGIGYDQSPVNDTDRNVQLPDNDRYVIALGGHYQACRAFGIDVGWTHLFIKQAHVAPAPVVTGSQTVSTSGHVNGGADVLGAQLTWDIV